MTVCTHLAETLAVTGSAKGGGTWMSVTDAAVSFDHPVHAHAVHTLNIDLRLPAEGPSARVAVELTAASARALAERVLALLDGLPEGLVEQG